jgi:hypothetical protein
MALPKSNNEKVAHDESIDQTEHDILASLAITNGFSNALDTSLNELLESFNTILGSIDLEVTDVTLEQFKRQELDCKYCLNRLVQSVEKLKGRVDNLNFESNAVEKRSGEGPS